MKERKYLRDSWNGFEKSVVRDTPLSKPAGKTDRHCINYQQPVQLSSRKAVGFGDGRYQRVSAAVLSDVIADNKELKIATKSCQSTAQPLHVFHRQLAHRVSGPRYQAKI